MIIAHLGFNDRLQDQLDLREAIEQSKQEQENEYDPNDTFNEWMDKIHPTERRDIR